LHGGAGVLTMMKYPEHFDFTGSGLVKVDDVLLYMDAAASGKEIVPRPAHSWVIAKRAERLGDRSLLGCALLLSPSALGVQQNVFIVPVGLRR
jgi:hypothetical protein